MKNYVLGAAALLFVGGMAFAQEDCINCDVEKPSHPEISVPQPPLGPNAFTLQESYVSQVGVGNEAFVHQEGYNISEIDQWGDNQAFVGGLGNLAVVDQFGGNYSNVKQHGDYNAAFVLQDGWGNAAYIDQGVGYAEYNIAGVKQFGNDNTSMQKQRYDFNAAFVLQDGNGNNAKQDQSTQANQQQGSAAAIAQIGDDNYAKQKQRGNINLEIA